MTAELQAEMAVARIAQLKTPTPAKGLITLPAVQIPAPTGAETELLILMALILKLVMTRTHQTEMVAVKLVL